MNARTFMRHRKGIMRLDTERQQKRAMDHLLRKSKAAIIVVNGKVVGWRMKDGTMVCAKTRFQTQERADIELERIAERAPPGSHIPIRAYACPQCRGFHLTSQQKSEAA
jgi:hypothetical protein